MTVDPGTAISVSDRFCRIFLHAIGTACYFFAGIELQHVALPFESDLPLSTVSVCLSVYLSVCPSVRPLVSNLGRAGK